MTKADLVNVVADKAKLQHRQAEVVVNLVFDLMSEALKKDDRIEIRGFGSFVSMMIGKLSPDPRKSGTERGDDVSITSFLFLFLDG